MINPDLVTQLLEERDPSYETVTGDLNVLSSYTAAQSGVEFDESLVAAYLSVRRALLKESKNMGSEGHDEPILSLVQSISEDMSTLPQEDKDPTREDIENLVRLWDEVRRVREKIAQLS